MAAHELHPEAFVNRELSPHRRDLPHRLPPPAVAPLGLRAGLVERIRREVAHARAGRPARIIAKMNGLADRRLIEELYAASAAGALKGRSENIRVVSIVDRYLEHARVFHFQNAGAPECRLASADWMPRNLDRRVEIAFPVLAPRLPERIREMLEVQLAASP
jgi:polyphosphate kinase